MVTQDLSKVTPKILAAGLMSLRELAIMPRIVNTSYGAEASARGKTIDVPLPSAITGVDVVAGATPQSPFADGSAPTTVPITMSNWKAAPFYMDDKEIVETMNGVIPMQASAAIRWLINQIDVSIINTLFKGTYNFIGSPTYVGFNPNSSYTSDPGGGAANVGVQKTADATNLRLILNKGLSPFEGRMSVVTPDVESNALQLRAFQDQSWSGSMDALIDGSLNRKLGFQWFMDQNIPAFVAGTITGTISVSGTAAIGATTVTVATDAAEAVVLNPGDLIKFSTENPPYVVTSAINIGASTTGSFSISPPLRVAATGGTMTLATKDSLGGTVSFSNGATYYNSMSFHRDAIAFASRPFDPVPPGLGVITDQAVDQISGVALRLEVKREHYRTRFSYDALWGTGLIRPELCARLVTIA